MRVVCVIFRACALFIVFGFCLSINSANARCIWWDKAELWEAFCSRSNTAGNATPEQQIAAQLIKPIPYTASDRATPKYQFIKYRTISTPLYVRLSVRGSTLFATRNAGVNCDTRSALHKFINLVGVDADGVFTILVRISNDGLKTEYIPIAALERRNGTCTTQITESQYISPYLRLDGSERVNLDIKITYSSAIRIAVVQQLLKAFEIGTMLFPNVTGAIGLMQDVQHGLTPKTAVVLTDAQKMQINSSATQLDAAVEALLKPLETDSKVTFGTDIDIRLMQGRYFKSDLGSNVNSVNGLKAANFAILAEPFLSVHMNEGRVFRTISAADIEGAPATVTTTGNTPTAEELSTDASLAGLGLTELQDLLRYGRPASNDYIVPYYPNPAAAVSNIAPFLTSEGNVSLLKKAQTDDLMSAAILRLPAENNDFDSICRELNTAMSGNLKLNSYDTLLGIYYYYRASAHFRQGRDLPSICPSIINDQTITVMNRMGLTVGPARPQSRALDWVSEQEYQTKRFIRAAKQTDLALQTDILYPAVFNEDVFIKDDEINLVFSNILGLSTAGKRSVGDAVRFVHDLQIIEAGCYFRTAQNQLTSNDVSLAFTSRKDTTKLFYLKLSFNPASPKPALINSIVVGAMTPELLTLFKSIHPQSGGCEKKLWG